MIEKSIADRFCIYWYNEDGEDWVQQLASLLGWPVMIETKNIEGQDGGSA